MSDVFTDEQEIARTIIFIVSLISSEKTDSITSKTEFVQDLAFQSLAIIEMGFAIQDLFDITPDAKTILDLKCIDDVVQVVCQQLGSDIGRMPTATELDEWAAYYSDEAARDAQ